MWLALLVLASVGWLVWDTRPRKATARQIADAQEVFKEIMSQFHGHGGEEQIKGYHLVACQEDLAIYLDATLLRETGRFVLQLVVNTRYWKAIARQPWKVDPRWRHQGFVELDKAGTILQWSWQNPGEVDCRADAERTRNFMIQTLYGGGFTQQIWMESVQRAAMS